MVPRFTTTRNDHSIVEATTSDSNCNEVVVEVIMEAVVMDEVVMIMPITMPSFVATVPGIVARTDMPNAWTNAAGSKMASMPTTWAKPPDHRGGPMPGNFLRQAARLTS